MSPCPVCAGRHLRGLTYQHRVACRLYAADASTAHHDFTHGTGIRLAREHEKDLINAQGYGSLDPDAGEHYGIRYTHAGGFHDRSVVVLDDHGRLLRSLELVELEGGDGPYAA